MDVFSQPRFRHADGLCSLACERMLDLAMLAAHKAGFGFSPDARQMAVTARLQRMLKDAGCERISEKAYAINFSAGTKAYEGMLENMTVMFQLFKPFLMQMGVVDDEEFEQLYRECLLAMMQHDFCGIWFFLLTWGYKPGQGPIYGAPTSVPGPELNLEPEDGGYPDAL
jgi:hypothetical protein